MGIAVGPPAFSLCTQLCVCVCVCVCVYNNYCSMVSINYTVDVHMYMIYHTVLLYIAAMHVYMNMIVYMYVTP